MENSWILKDSYVIKMLQHVITIFKKYSEKLVSRKAPLLHLVIKIVFLTYLLLKAHCSYSHKFFILSLPNDKRFTFDLFFFLEKIKFLPNSWKAFSKSGKKCMKIYKLLNSNFIWLKVYCFKHVGRTFSVAHGFLIMDILLALNSLEKIIGTSNVSIILTLPPTLFILVLHWSDLMVELPTVLKTFQYVLIRSVWFEQTLFG